MGHTDPLDDSHSSIVARSNTKPDDFALTGSFVVVVVLVLVLVLVLVVSISISFGIGIGISSKY